MDKRERLSGIEAAQFIIGRWRMEHDAASIMLQLITLGKPVRKCDVLFVIRCWCDSETENKLYKRAK